MRAHLKAQQNNAKYCCKISTATAYNYYDSGKNSKAIWMRNQLNQFHYFRSIVH